MKTYKIKIHAMSLGFHIIPVGMEPLADLNHNLNDLARRYDKDVIVVEYSQLKKEVNQLSFNVYNGHGKGSAIWEPLGSWEAFFDAQGKSNDYLKMYDQISKEYLGNTTLKK